MKLKERDQSYTELLCVTGSATTIEGAGVTKPRPIGSTTPRLRQRHRHSQNCITMSSKPTIDQSNTLDMKQIIWILLEYSFTLRDHVINNIHVTQHYITAESKYVATQQDCKRTKSPENKQRSQTHTTDTRLPPGNPELLVDVHQASTNWMKNFTWTKLKQTWVLEVLSKT